jgi:uncharacterized protein
MKISPVIAHWAFDPEFLGRRMSFLTGPRQIGKTTLALRMLERLGQEKNYFNWDTVTVKRRYAQNPVFFLENIPEPPPVSKRKNMPEYIIVFDEFHKNLKWKQLLKGYYDEFGSFVRFVVCGSARLDVFRKSGESLLGRYFITKMHPLGPKDIVNGERFQLSSLWNPEDRLDAASPSGEFRETVEDLFHMTGFPEPFLKGRKDFYRRWRDEHLSLLATEEVRDLSRISNFAGLQTFALLLPERVGSTISINNLAQTLSCAHATVNTWLDAFEQVYMVFRIPPFTENLSRAVRKEKKVYFWDWGVVEDEGKRFENFLAVQLLRTISAWTEWGKGSFGLHFVRTKDGRETDFLITKERKPFILIEAKLSGTAMDRSLLYFRERLSPLLAFQVIWGKDILRQVSPGVFLIDIFRFLSLLV